MQEALVELIAKIAYWKQIAHENDNLDAVPWYFPRVAATVDSLNRAEKFIGISLPIYYKEFLKIADGWQGFFVSTDLFGTSEIISGKIDEVRRREDVKAYIASVDLSENHVLPVGSSDDDADVFLLISDEAYKNAGELIWIAGGEIDRYENFRMFLESMVNYNAALARKLIEQR